MHAFVKTRFNKRGSLGDPPPPPADDHHRGRRYVFYYYYKFQLVPVGPKLNRNTGTTIRMVFGCAECLVGSIRLARMNELLVRYSEAVHM